MKPAEQTLARYLAYLKLRYLEEHFQSLADQAAREQWTPVQYLTRLIEGEALARQDRATQKRLKAARFPVLKTLEQFDWSWPKKLNRPQVQHLFGLAWIQQKANVVLLGGCGLGKTHLSIALAHEACLRGHSVLFTTAVDIINSLMAAQTLGRLKKELQRYLKPALLAIDELGYLPIDKPGADLLFQIFSHRYERGSLLITTNQPYKQWAKIFNHDSTIASAVLDRLLHHAETIVVEGKSYRMKDNVSED
jgi:DNA replication protein DnaC